MSSYKFKLLIVFYLFCCLNLSAVFAGNYAKNGIVYLLLNDSFDSSKTHCVSGLPGVWRLSNPDGKPYTPWKLYNNVISARGLSVNQEKATSVFFLNTSKGTLSTMKPGTLPDIDPSDDSCPLWVSVVEPTESGMAGTWQYAFNSAKSKTVSGAYAKGRSAHVFDSVNYRYWYNEPSAYNGANYDFIVRFNGPNGVKFFNGLNKNDGLGTPMWKGPNNGEIRHTNYSVNRKIILPSHFAAVGRYLYATKFNKTFAKGTEMNGLNGTTEILYTQANKMGNAWDAMLTPGDIQDKALSRTDNNTYALQRSSSYKHPYFGCVVKMIYSQRTNTLDLKRGIDNTNNTWPTKQGESAIGNAPNGTGLLETTDYTAVKYLGKWCGDSCIPGGDLDAEQQTPIKNEINVVTTTTGNVYGFNPKGSPTATDKKAMLRFVKLLTGETHGAINISSFNNFKNKSYLTGKGEVADLKNIGVSSNFSASTVYDYIYGSFADRFVVQDSWWGLGGIAYEYDKSTKKVTKLDYMNSTDGKPVSEEKCGSLYGNIDAIGVDGDAYLYALKTEGEPNDDKCKTPGLSPDLTSSGNQSIGGYSVYVTVSGWRRSSDGEGSSSYSSIANGKQKSGDWREVKIQQTVYKSVYRYKEGQSFSDDTDLRGRLKIGYDYWVGYITCRGSYNTIGTFGPLGDSKTRAADLHAELAVVNVADSPVTFPGSDDHYVVVKDSNMRSGDKISEEGKLTFKIEGLRPRYSGVTRNFKNMNSFKLAGESSASTIYVNNVHNNTTGEMTHDENHDGIYSGFPSTMFESAVKPTTVTWYIYQVDEKTANSIIPSTSAKVVRKCVDGSTTSSKNGAGLCSIDYTFKQPGRYIVQARIMYYLFSNYGDALRPTDLKAVSTTVYTKPFLVNVYAKDLNYNGSPSYITNITTDFDPGPRTKNQLRNDYAGIPTNAPNSGSILETQEKGPNKNKNKFGNIRIEFDAKFFGLKENNTGANFQTFDGIGVWDYNYYQAIYSKMNKDSGYNIGVLYDDTSLKLSTKTPYTSKSYHVYNFIKNSDNNVTSVSDSSYNSNYNPGFNRIFTEDSSRTYRAGTGATGEIYDCDKAFIQYVLYLRDLPDHSTPESPNKNTDSVAYTPQQEISRSSLNRGKVISAGSIMDFKNDEDFVFRNISDDRGIERKFHVGFTIKNIESPIYVPRDPKEYVIDLEIIYPRVYWKLDEEKEGSTTRVYRSSLVPYNSLTAKSAPVHVLSNLITTKGTNNLFNQSDLTRADTSDLSIGSFTLCVRDAVNPTPFYGFEKTDYFSDVKNKNELKSDYMIYESTGDELATGSFYYGVEDNNPFMRFSQENKPVGVVATETARTSGIQVYRQILEEDKIIFDKKDSRFEKSKKYTKTKKEDKEAKVRQSSVKNSYNYSDFYADNGANKGDDWKIYVTYHDKVSEVSACNPKGLSKKYSLTRPKDLSNNGDWSKYPCNIYPENWIGTLNYAIYGPVYDGYGTQSVDILHYIYSDEAANNGSGYPAHSFSSKGEKLEVSSIPYLERFDNDPPSIGLEVISQNDSAKWNIELIEDVNDPKSFGVDDKGLAKSKFKATQYDLNGNEIAGSEKTYDFDGTTNVYQAKTGAKPSSGEAKPKKDGYIAEYSNPIMTFKKSSRLIINVDIFDNCGFEKLSDAWIKVQYGDTVLLEETKLKNLAASHDEKGLIKTEFKLKPRETFVVDLPSHITDDMVTIDVYAKDLIGNERQLRVHGTLAETSFDARVIEHSENKN